MNEFSSVQNTDIYGPHPQFPKSVKPGIPKLLPIKIGWREVYIGDLFEVKNRPVKMQDYEMYNLVTVKRSRGGVVEREKLIGKKIAVKSQFYVETGDFLISKRQIVHGACGFVPDFLNRSIVSNEYSVLRCSPLILPEFLNYLSHTPYFQQTCFHSSIGVHVEKLIFKLGDWFKWKIHIPQIEEQQKIASFLTSIDDKLTKLRRKRDLLNDFKRGLMQQLFSQTIRFKQDDGIEFPEWKSDLISDVYSWIKTNSLSREGLSTDAGKVQNIHYGDIHTRFPSHLKQSEVQIPFIKDEQFVLKLSENEFCKKGDLLIADASEDYADIGKALEIVDVKENSLISGLHTYIARPKHKMALGFSGYLFQSPDVRRLIQKIAQGVSVLGISKTNLGKIEIQLPCFEEQQKIADCLSSFDAKIDAVVKQIQQLDTFKKGLLQKMFV